MRQNNTIEAIQYFFQKKDYESALRIIYSTMKFMNSDFYYRESVQVVECFDQICDGVGEVVCSDLKKGGEYDSNVNVYLASELYATGGHTLCIKNFIEAQPEKQHIIYVTFQSKNTMDRVKKLRFNAKNITLVEYPHSDTKFLTRIEWLQNQLSQIKPERCFLFNHPFDSSIIASVRPCFSKDVYLYLHANASPNLGLTLSYIKLIPIFQYECLKLSKFIPLERLCYIPLTLPEASNPPIFKPNIENIIVSASSISAVYKMETPYHYSFEDYVVKLLKKTRGVHILIGTFSQSLINNIVNKIKKYGLGKKNIIHIQWVPSLMDALQELNVNLYLSTFPMSGGLTLIEIMSVGIPIIFHSSYNNPRYTMPDLVYPEAFVWRTESDFDNILNQLTIDELKKHHDYSLTHFNAVHHQQHLSTVLNQSPMVGCPIDLVEVEKKTNDFYTHNELLTYLDHLEYRKISLNKSMSLLNRIKNKLFRYFVKK